MTATLETIICPPWCTTGTDQYPCRGEHSAISAGSYIPASAGHFGRVETIDGHAGDFVGVGLYWAQAWGEGVELNITTTTGAPFDDRQVNFKLAEALAFATEIVLMLDAAVAGSGISIGGFGDKFIGEMIEELVGSTESLRDHLKSEVPA